MIRIGIIFAAVHACVISVIFGSAIAYPARAGLLPLVAVALDFPFSLLFEFVSSKMGVAGSRILVVWLLYGLLGSAWFFALGCGVQRMSGRHR